MTEHAEPTPKALVQVVLRWAFPLAALLVVGPLVYLLTDHLRTRSGDADVSLLLNRSPLLGLAALLVSVAAAAALGLAARLLTNSRTAFRTAGFTLAWAAWGSGAMNELLHQHPSGGAVILLAIEGLLVLAAGAATLPLLLPPEPNKPRWGALRSLASPPSLAALGAGAAGAIAVCFLIALDSARGQALVGAIVAAVAGAAAARFATIRMDEQPSPLALHLAPLLAAVLSPLILFVAPGIAELSSAAALDAIPAPARIQPLDWLAGALLGVPIGLAWVGSMLESENANAHAERGVRHA